MQLSSKGQLLPLAEEMHTDDPDSTLVSAVQAGDKRAFAILFERHRPTLLALCRRMCGNRVQAEDAVQEAAIQALLSIDRLRRPERFGSWLAGIGLNVCRLWLRRRPDDERSLEALYGGRWIPEPTALEPGPEEIVEAADLARRVRRAVDDLPAGQRSAILLFYLAGMTYAETAAALGIKTGAVKTRLHKARRTLQHQLYKMWEEAYMAAKADSQLVEMRVTNVRWGFGVHLIPNLPKDNPSHTSVVLQEVNGPRTLQIWMGRTEVEAIAVILENIQLPRPMTYHFTASLLQATGWWLKEVRINRVSEGVFYALAVIEGPEGTAEIDARPSDAINLSLIAGSPIMVEPKVIEAAAAVSEPVGTGGAADLAAEIRDKLRKNRVSAQPENALG